MAQLILQIIQRVKSYKITKWHYRNPNIFNPYKLSSIGYQCTALNTLQCHICHNTVVFSNNNYQDKKQQQILQQLSNHEQTCLYYNENMKIFSIAQLYLRMDQLILPIKQSYKNIANNSTILLPKLKWNKFIKQLQNNRQYQILVTIMNKYKIDIKNIRISFILTIMGWYYKNQQQLQCQFCGRSVNIKDYQTCKNNKQNIQQGQQNMQAQRQQSKYLHNTDKDKKQQFDIFDEHRYFCLWVNQQKGWQIYIQHMYDTLGQAQQLFKNQNPQNIQKIRTLIDGYLHRFKNNISQNFQKANKILYQCADIVKQIQEKQQDKQQIDGEVRKRTQQMKQFLQQIQNQVREPLKRIKID